MRGARQVGKSSALRQLGKQFKHFVEIKGINTAGQSPAPAAYGGFPQQTAGVMRQTEGKFVYERAAPGTPSAAVKQALELLIMAGLVHPVTHTCANGIPSALKKMSNTAV